MKKFIGFCLGFLSVFLFAPFALASNVSFGSTINDGVFISGSGTQDNVIQTFVPNSAQSLTGFTVQLRAVSSYDAHVFLYAVSGGVPSGSALSTSNVLSVSGGYSWADYNFSFSPFSLTSGASYAFVIKPTSSIPAGTAQVGLSGNNYASGAVFQCNSSFSCSNSGIGNTDLYGSYDYSAIVVNGCTDPIASNYNSNATHDDGSCIYPLPPGRHNLSFPLFGGTAPSVGTPVGGSDFVASAGTAVSETIGNISPIIEVVAGLILAFILMRFLINLFKETDPKKQTNRDMKADLEMYHHSNAEMSAKGIDPYKVENFDESNS